MFFSHHYSKGVSWYASFFGHCGDARIRGEVCPSYLSCSAAPDRIAEVLGRPKLLVTLRRPSEQIASLYELWLARGQFDASLEQAIESKTWLIENVMYAKHIRNFERVFGVGCVKVFLYDLLVEDSQAYLNEICDALDVEHHPVRASEGRTNSTRSVRSDGLERVIAKGGDFLRRNGLLGFKSVLNRTGGVAFLKRINTRRLEVPVISGALLERIADSTRRDRQELGEMLGKDLSDWI